MDRRSFLVGGALLGGNLTGRSDALAAAMARVPALDVHHHMLPPFYKPAALAWLERLGRAPCSRQLDPGCIGRRAG